MNACWGKIFHPKCVCWNCTWKSKKFFDQFVTHVLLFHRGVFQIENVRTTHVVLRWPQRIRQIEIGALSYWPRTFSYEGQSFACPTLHFVLNLSVIHINCYESILNFWFYFCVCARHRYVVVSFMLRKIQYALSQIVTRYIFCLFFCIIFTPSNEIFSSFSGR